MRTSILLALALSGCPKSSAPLESPEPVAVETAEHARLVVLVVLDQFPMELLEAGRPHFTGGLARLTSKDAAQGTAVYPYATTQTCPGHVTLATGTEPAKSGIVANYLLAADGTETYCSDLGLLRTEPVADAIREGGGKVAALSLKDRAALFLGGTEPELVAWYDLKAEAIVNAEDLVSAERQAEIWSEIWTPGFDLDRVDDRPKEGGLLGLTATFPHGPADALEGKARLATPAAGTLLTEMGIAAVDRVGLGAEGGGDLLTLSYSNTDYVGHYFTASSLEALDNLLRVDAELERLFSHLDATVGAGEYAVLLSSDHGGEDDPSDYIEGEPIAARVAERLASEGIGGELVFSWPEATVKGAQSGREAEAYAIAVEEIAASPGVLSAFTTDAIPDGPFAEAVRLSYDRERSAPIYGISEEGVVFDWYGGTGSDHGSPHAYDQRVPFLAFGAGVTPGDLGDVDIRQVAPTLAALVGKRAPKDTVHDSVFEAE